jgi:hypothetical protein
MDGDLLNLTQIYEVSKTVAEALTACADSEGYTFAVLEPREDETPERKQQLHAEASEIDDLVQLDILKDVSYRFAEQINNCRREHGFGYTVVAMTDIGVAMFRSSKYRKDN